MSLKAKLEAVIYAAEEPVTLAQIAALFAADALEWKSVRDAATAAADAEQAAPGGETLPLLNAELEQGELEQPPEAPVAAGQEAGPETSPETGPDTVAETGALPAAEAAVESPAEPAAEMPVDAEAEAKRLARQRDREVRAILRGLLDELIASYASDERGIEIKEIAGGYRMATKPECHDAARLFVKSLKPAMKLSLPALETLAVIAYKQPVTAPEVNEIRGVDSSGVFGSLLARKLIATAGRKPVIGRPILYKTTKEFLLRFGLKDVTELPSMDEFEKMAQLEFEDMEPVAEEAAGETIEGPEVDDEPDEESAAAGAWEVQERSMQEDATQVSTETAATADSEEVPAAPEPDTTESVAGAPAMEAEKTPAEAAPAVPSPLEQAETETVPHD
ncbi:MAG: SMC-Scp complex subunit ScpB [Terracidiphilus sp.]|jgi:segregation and condensation protein B